MSDSKKMTVHEVVCALAAGKKIKRPHWPKNCYVCIHDGALRDESDNRDIDVFLDDNWVLFKESKKTKKLYQYAYLSAYHGGWALSLGTYSDDLDFTSRSGFGVAKFKKIENSFIEVECE